MLFDLHDVAGLVVELLNPIEVVAEEDAVEDRPDLGEDLLHQGLVLIDGVAAKGNRVDLLHGQHCLHERGPDEGSLLPGGNGLQPRLLPQRPRPHPGALPQGRLRHGANRGRERRGRGHPGPDSGAPGGGRADPGEQKDQDLGDPPRDQTEREVVVTMAFLSKVNIVSAIATSTCCP